MTQARLNTSVRSAFSPLSCYLESIHEQTDSSYNSLSSENVDEQNMTTRQRQSLFFKGPKKMNVNICKKEYLHKNSSHSQKKFRLSDLVTPSKKINLDSGQKHQSCSF